MIYLNSIYRNYDIRGEYPSQIHEDEVFNIGRALVDFLGLKTIAVGRDNRPSGETLFTALEQGIHAQGGKVIDIGLVTTPMSYFADRIGVDATVMITASHMPSNFNGLKICTKGSEPVSAEILKQIESYIQEQKFNAAAHEGVTELVDIKTEWKRFFVERFNFKDSNYSVVVDPANMIGVLEIDTLRQFEPHLTVHSIYDELDHTCPNHEANPVKFETLKDLGIEVVKTSSHIGVAFDGDADRIGFVDEDGKPVPSDVIGTIIASYLIEHNLGKNVVYALTATKALPKIISEKGHLAFESAVGHTNVKKVMREQDAMLGIELSGHFFFKETGSTEAGLLPLFYVLSEMQRRNKSLAELAKEVISFHHTGEVNSQITLSIDEIYKRLKEKYSDGTHNEIDGLKVIYDDWWFNVRPSANDPVMRLNLEADTKEIMNQRLKEVLEIIRSNK